MSDNISFRSETALGQTLLRWWQGLDNNRGDRAELRRAHNLTAIALTSAYQHLYRILLSRGWAEAYNRLRVSLYGDKLKEILGLPAEKPSKPKKLPKH